MAVTAERTRPRALHPVHAFFLATTVPLFLGTVLSDIAYWSSYEVQWANFAAWLNVGGLVMGALVLVAALIGLRHADRRGGRYLAYSLLVLAMWVVGLINALVHAKDAWATMPEGLVLSVVVAVLACFAAWLGFASLRTGGAR